MIHPTPRPTGPASTSCGTSGQPQIRPAAGPDLLTLASVPLEVDAQWWRRHGHLVEDPDASGYLQFRAGTPLDALPGEARAPLAGSCAAPLDQRAALAGLSNRAELVARFECAALGSRARGKLFPHVLLKGPVGTPKSALAQCIAGLTGQPLTEVSAARVTDLAAWLRLLAGVAPGSVLFVDEAQALRPALLGALLDALAGQELSLTLLDGTRARTVTLHLASFTLVAATTDESALPRVLWTHFGLRETLLLPYVPLDSDEASSDEASNDEASSDEASSDEASSDEGHIDEGYLDEAYTDAAYLARKPDGEAGRERAWREQAAERAEEARGADVERPDWTARPAPSERLPAPLPEWFHGRLREALRDACARRGHGDPDRGELDRHEPVFLQALQAAARRVPRSRLARALRSTPPGAGPHPRLASGSLRRLLASSARRRWRVALRHPRPGAVRGAPNVRRIVGRGRAAP